MGLGGYFYYMTHFHRVVLQAFLRSHKKEAIHQQVADGVEDQTFNLPDGSLVRLGKTGRLYYPTDWPVGPNPREVFLQGEAFFDIRKNPAAPFYVYTDQVIIRVLGTSFVVHSLPSDARTMVTVVTGKVSVYRQEDFYSPLTGKGEPVGMVLTPNQVGVYDRGEDRLHKTLIGMPEQLGDKPDSLLVFHGTPIREVFGRLRELYGIPIQYDEEAVDRCAITATLGSGSFYDKLNVICKAIGGSYVVIDGNVVVSTAGCK
jgi:transmembrane sensor